MHKRGVNLPPRYFLKTLYSIYLLPVLLLRTVRVMSEMLTPLSDSRHTKAGGMLCYFWTSSPWPQAPSSVAP